MIKKYCDENNMELLYYRKFKEGHIPMYREVKVKAKIGGNIGKFKKWAEEEHIRLENANK